MFRYGLALLWCGMYLLPGLISGGSPTLDYRPETSRLLDALLRSTNPSVLPMPQDGSPVEVSYNIYLRAILEIDTSENMIEIYTNVATEWKDYSFMWDSQFSSIPQVHIPVRNIWTPDITFEEDVGSQTDVKYPNILTVTNKGKVQWWQKHRFRFPCDLSSLSTFNNATCKLKFGSWTYGNHLLTLNVSGNSDALNSMLFFPESKFEIIHTRSENIVEAYLQSSYDFIEAFFTFRRKEPLQEDQLKTQPQVQQRDQPQDQTAESTEPLVHLKITSQASSANGCLIESTLKVHGTNTSVSSLIEN